MPCNRSKHILENTFFDNVSLKCFTFAARRALFDEIESFPQIGLNMFLFYFYSRKCTKLKVSFKNLETMAMAQKAVKFFSRFEQICQRANFATPVVNE